MSRWVMLLLLCGCTSATEPPAEVPADPFSVNEIEIISPELAAELAGQDITPENLEEMLEKLRREIEAEERSIDNGWESGP